MTPERWRRVEALFYDALEHNDADRDAFLDACDDVSLSEEVRSLLDAGDESGRIGGVVVDALDPTGPAPERFGPYRVIRELGRGGLGTVYLAERDDEHYSMRVAVKLVRRGLDTDDILARLRQERQILARLEHPNITRLLDGGSTENGQPYLAMEYVDGTSLHTFAHRRELSVRHRVRLVLDVCSAVSMAHRNLIIHRDIKPSNVMVTEQGVVKLLDFGIAKLLDHDSEIEPTRPELRLLTPDYASPEQLRGDSLSTATDIYSLGAMLYRLLTGHAPFERRDSPEALPVKPSRRLDDGAARRLKHQLQGDLDNIVLKAMAVDAQDRYGSVPELADDLRRYLEDRPVRARPPGLTLRTWKWVRRNRLAATAALAIGLSLMIGMASTAWQARHARRAQAEAERISTFLAELLEASTPEVAQGEVVPVRSVLDRGAERIANELADEPEAQTRLMTTMGRAYLSLGVYDQAAELHRKALEIRREIYGSDHLTTAESAHALAEVLINLGDLEQAETLLQHTIELRRNRLGPQHVAVAEALKDLGIVHRRALRPDQAEDALTQALHIVTGQLGEQHGDTAGVLNSLGVLYLTAARFNEAETMLRRATTIYRSVLGDSHPDTLTSLGNLARVLRQLGSLEEAQEVLETVLEENLRMLGEYHREVAVTHNSLAKILDARGKPDEAIDHYHRAVEILAAVLGDGHREVAIASTNLGQSLLRAERTPEAERALRRGLSIHDRYGGHPELARTLEQLGTLLCKTERPGEAVSLLNRAIDVRRQAHDAEADQWRIAAAQARLGACLLSLDRASDALPLLCDAHTGMVRRFTADSPWARRVEALLERAQSKRSPMSLSQITGSCPSSGESPGGSESSNQN